MSGIPAWLVLVGLGAFHGINPAMGWLFAVALGLHRQSRKVVWLSLLPIALGHAVSVGLVVLAANTVGLFVDRRALELAAGLLLIGWALYHAIYGHRHRVRVGMKTGMAGLGLWSFVMATTHGAGMMLVPVTLPLSHTVGTAHATGSFIISLAAVALHTGVMLAVTGAIAFTVYEWVGIGFLRTGWINLDWLWVTTLVVAGAILVV